MYQGWARAACAPPMGWRRRGARSPPPPGVLRQLLVERPQGRKTAQDSPRLQRSFLRARCSARSRVQVISLTRAKDVGMCYNIYVTYQQGVTHGYNHKNPHHRPHSC